MLCFFAGTLKSSDADSTDELLQKGRECSRHVRDGFDTLLLIENVERFVSLGVDSGKKSVEYDRAFKNREASPISRHCLLVLWESGVFDSEDSFINRKVKFRRSMVD
jgi:hypothetical protein